jgi:hypothetical protein
MTVSNSYQGSTFKEVRDQVFSDPYPTLPLHVVTLGSFFHGLKNVLLKATQRALNDPSDIAPYFQKLVHPNGVALAGTWHITEKSPYTGYFSQGSTALIIARCSVLQYKTTRGNTRAFGFAGKVFPTTDPTKRVRTADFFTIDVLAGTKAAHYTDVALTNEPPTGFNIDVLRSFGVGLVAFLTFVRADHSPSFRPTYPVAELGLPEGTASASPHWIMLRASPGSGQSENADSRDELMIENYANHTLRFDLSTAETRLPSGERNWKHMGHIDFTESVASESCDHRLVFQHPKLRKI